MELSSAQAFIDLFAFFYLKKNLKKGFSIGTVQCGMYINLLTKIKKKIVSAVLHQSNNQP